MELHRLKSMPVDYDQELFDKFYNDCCPYMDKLARTICPKYFNVTPDIIRSWFDDKFIFAYSKYHNEMSDKSLKSYLLKSVKQFRVNLIKRAHSQIAENNIKLLSTDNTDTWVKHQMEVIADEPVQVDEVLLEEVKKEMRAYLDEDEFLFFKLTLNPPPAVLKSKQVNIPNLMWARFLGLPETTESDLYIEYLRDKIRKGIKQVRKKYRRGTITFSHSYQ